MTEKNIETPPILYKYRSINTYSWNLLLKGELYFPFAHELNDPYDCSLAYLSRDTNKYELAELNKFIDSNNAFQQHEKDILKSDLLTSDFKDRLISYIGKLTQETSPKIQAETQIYSLSKLPTIYLMWSYYTKDHQGFCIGFDTKILQKLLDSEVRSVIYRTKHPNYDILKFNNNNDFYYIKSKDWKHEKEYRLVDNTGRGCLFTLPPEAVKEIVLGVNITESDKKLIKSIVLYRYPLCKVYQIKMKTGNFGLVKRRIHL